MSASASALVAFSGWFILLTLGLAGTRSALTLTGKREANSFAVDGSDVGGFGQRLNRARDNVFENLPVMAALILAASMTDQLAVTDPLAWVVVYARIGQSVTHMISTSVPAVFARFGFYGVQVLIWLWWTIQLL